MRSVYLKVIEQSSRDLWCIEGLNVKIDVCTHQSKLAQKNFTCSEHIFIFQITRIIHSNLLLLYFSLQTTIGERYHGE